MEKINKLSEESQDLIADITNTEIFELCENCSKQQWPDCNAYWEMGIIFFSCGRNVKSTRSPTEFDQNNRDVTSVPGYVINKTEAVEPSMELLKDTRCTTMRSKCLERPDRESTEAILRYSHDGTLVMDTGSHYLTPGGENTTSYCTTGSAWKSTSTKLRGLERIQISKNWILTANAEGGTQLPLNQRPDIAQAKRECKRLHDEHLARTQQEYRDNPRSQQRKQRKGQQFEGNEEYDYAVDPKTGWRFYRQSRGILQTSSSSSSTWANLQDSFVIVVNVGPNPVEDEQLEFSAFSKPWRLVIFSQS